MDPLRPDANRRPFRSFVVIFTVIFGTGTILIALGAPDWLLIAGSAVVGPLAVRVAQGSAHRTQP